MKLSILTTFLLATHTVEARRLGGGKKKSKCKVKSRKFKGKSISVTNANDSGAGSLRQALMDGNKIKISSEVGDIALATTLNYDGTDGLSIEGAGQTIMANADFDILSINNGADLRIEDLTFAGTGSYNIDTTGDGKGLYVEIPATAKGTVYVEFSNVTVKDVAYHGVHISDCTIADRNACGNGNDGSGDGSDASVEVSVENFTIMNVGQGRFDGDGFRVDERGSGSIYFNAVDSVFDNAGADGVELDEAGPGDVEACLENTELTSNGNFCGPADGLETTYPSCFDDGELDLDDGIDIDEGDDGSIYLDVYNSAANGNFDEGFDIDEAGNGDLVANFENVDAADNRDEAIKLSEEDNGDLEATLYMVTVTGSKDNDGIQFDETGNGDIVAELTEVSSTGNENDGIKIEEDGDDNNGDIKVEIMSSTFSDNNDGEGITLESKTGDGEVEVHIYSSTFNGNGKEGIDISSEKTASVSISDTEGSDNTDEDLKVEGASSEDSLELSIGGGSTFGVIDTKNAVFV